MRRLAISLIAATAAMAVVPAAASAAPWTPIHQRQAHLERRIDQGVRSGQLTRHEAYRLRSQFAFLNRLEQRYRRSGGGLSMRERADLDQRFDRLSAEIRFQKHDYQRRG